MRNHSGGDLTRALLQSRIDALGGSARWWKHEHQLEISKKFAEQDWRRYWVIAGAVLEVMGDGR